jgi:hypothetical protein
MSAVSGSDLGADTRNAAVAFGVAPSGTDGSSGL